MSTDYHFHGMTARADMIEALEQYVNVGMPLGDFLRSVVSNDLREACGRADHQNLHNIPALVAWLYNTDSVPGICWGSPQRYKDWLDRHAAIRAAKARASTESGDAP
jgi:hypothetical protein